MTRRGKGKLTKNDNGGHVYFGPDFLNDSLNPLEPGRKVDYITIPNTGVLVVPKDSLDLPSDFTVRDPDR